MHIRQNIASIAHGLANRMAPTQANNFGDNPAQDFFRYGNGRITVSDWSQLRMNERDKYTGYMYGATTRRANKVVDLATNHLKTKANDPTTKAAKDAQKSIVHPYLEIIDRSLDFTNEEFWEAAQTYLDLKGVYYLLAVRGKLGEKVGDVKSFELMSPYDVTVVRNGTGLEVLGYVQTLGGMQREIPPHQIITIRALNPFSHIDPFSMADAATDSQFTIKETSEQMRTTARRNRKYPGVVLMGNGEVSLDPQQVDNFKARMRGKANSTNDEPVFAAGSASKLSWTDMQIDLRKSAVDTVSEISLNGLIAVTGTSKTKFGIEQSGVTRDTASIQEDLFTGDHAIPGLQRIIGALNQDYKRHYPVDYEKYGYVMYIDSPLGDDATVEAAKITNRQTSFELYQSLIDAGYDADTASAYASGEKDLSEIGEPTNEPKPKPVPPVIAPPAPVGDDPAKTNGHTHELPPAIINDLDASGSATLTRQQGALRNAVVAVEGKLVHDVLAKVTTNQFEDTSDIVDDQDRQAAETDLQTALSVFYGITLPLSAGSTMSARMKEFGLAGSFKPDAEVDAYIKLTATRAADGHIETILEDILETVQATEERLVQGELQKITPKPGQTSEDVLAEARRLALEGNGREEIARAIRQTYTDTISKTRANTIARTETNRAYGRGQYEADRQFLAQNDLTHKAYKQWITRSDNPCPYCVAKSKEPPIPFLDAFAKVGDVLQATFTKSDGTASIRQMQVGFEDCLAGEIHPNGQCTYQLIIR